MMGSPRKGVRDARCREVMMAARNNTHAYTVPRILTDVVTITNMQAAHIIHSSETILLIRGDTAHGGADTSLDWGLNCRKFLQRVIILHNLNFLKPAEVEL